KPKRRRQVEEPRTDIAPVPHPIRNDLVPKLELVELAPEDLRIPARNVRKIDRFHIREIAAAVTSLGFCDPILIDEQNRVLDGVIRAEAAKLIGLPHIPCIRASHLTAAERRLVRLALNRLGEKGSWDFDALKLELGELIIDNAPIEITGFSMTEVDDIVLEDEPESVEVGPLAPEPDAKPIAQLGDIFALGEHRVICGDATDPNGLDLLMVDDQARLILTDQPHAVSDASYVRREVGRAVATAKDVVSDAEFRAFNAAWMGAGMRHLGEGGLFGTFIDWRSYFALVEAAIAHDLTSIDLIVWAKANGGTDGLYRSQHELLPLFKKGGTQHSDTVKRSKNSNNRRRRSNVWTYPGASSASAQARQELVLHPAVKPIAMLKDAILDMTEAGEIVLDPFLGSGSILIAAENTGRRCRGVELEPLYIDVIIRRYEAASGRPAILAKTGETFAELALRRGY